MYYAIMNTSSESQVFGVRLAKVRKGRDLTLQALSTKSGVSTAMLSEIERGKRQPTIVLASKIAKALGTSLGMLVDEEVQETTLLNKLANQRVLVDPISGIRRISLVEYFLKLPVEVIRFELPPLADTGNFSAHSGGTAEHLTVIEGEVVVRLDHETFVVSQGDCLSYRADRSHGFSNPLDRVTALHLVIVRRANEY